VKSVHGNIIGEVSFDFAYPNIAYSGKYEGDDEALITFNHTSTDSFPGFSAVFYNSSQGYSSRVTLKAGSSYVFIPIQGLRQRWGDYSGSQRKYNQPGTVWASGFIGERINLTLAHSTWIAEIASPDTTQQPPAAAVNPVRKEPQVFPNPADDIFSVEFEMNGDAFVDISLFDASGRLVKNFIHDGVKAGKNKFSFSLKPLATGIYYLRIRSGNQIIASQKVVKKS
jgi:hypothetical protein